MRIHPASCFFLGLGGSQVALYPLIGGLARLVVGVALLLLAGVVTVLLRARTNPNQGGANARARDR